MSCVTCEYTPKNLPQGSDAIRPSSSRLLSAASEAVPAECQAHHAQNAALQQHTGLIVAPQIWS